ALCGVETQTTNSRKGESPQYLSVLCGVETSQLGFEAGTAVLVFIGPLWSGNHAGGLLQTGGASVFIGPLWSGN
ncbi:MAG: hypothetical protein NZ611_09005, partial [Bacteroidia bacterium]|nr:hypothetical protein [Bacteroidia bacterium]